ncbi:MAG: aldo/keto reductase [Rhodospirillaceae bacterium]|nr:MAG: aldo/keto reductase [Rhodospirillaceae bacterium]
MNQGLNGTGWEVRPIGLGAMPLSIAGRPAESQAFEVVAAFVESGGNFIDTSNVYCLDDSDIGHNEHLLDKALTRIGAREAVLVATKGGLRRPKGAWVTDGSQKWLRASCEKSLNDLQCEAIPLYYLHAVDSNVPFDDSLGELIQLKEEGKILNIGLSNIDRAELEFALGRTAVAAVQNRCNPFFKKDFNNGLVRLCQEKGIAYVPYSPVGGHGGHVRLPKHPLFRRLSEKYEASPYGIALAWLLQKGHHIFPIPGASRVSSVRDSAQALHVRIEPNDVAEIDRLPDQALF